MSRCWSTRTISWTGRDREGPGKAVPYGIYVIAANTGWLGVGTEQDSAAFAVASIRHWWQARGRHGYPAATRLVK